MRGEGLSMMSVDETEEDTSGDNDGADVATGFNNRFGHGDHLAELGGIRDSTDRGGGGWNLLLGDGLEDGKHSVVVCYGEGVREVPLLNAAGGGSRVREARQKEGTPEQQMRLGSHQW